MKKTMKKLLICILIVSLLNSFFISNVQASDGIKDMLDNAINSVVGALTYPVRLIAVLARVRS